MAIIRWNPISEMDALHSQIDRIFEEMVGSSLTNVNIKKPAVELIDNEEHLVLRAEIPGVEAKDLDISVTREAVTIRGENRYSQENKDKGYFHSEFHYGKFERVVGLPVPIDNNQVKAEFHNGILTLNLPKAEEVRNRMVKVKLGEDTEKPNLETAEINHS